MSRSRWVLDKLTGRVTDFIDDVLLPDEQRTTLLRAQKAERDGDLHETLRLLDDLDAQRPGLTRALELRGQALLGLGRPAEAAEALRKAAAQRPEARTLHLLGLALEAAGDRRTARDALREALQSEADPALRAEIHRALGRVHASTGRPDRAARELRKGLRALADLPEEERQPSQRRLQIDLAAALLARGELAEARAVLDEALPEGAAPSDNEPALRTLGHLLMREGRFAQSLPCLEALLRLRPDDLEVATDAARAALGAGALDIAQAHLESAVARAEDEGARAALSSLLGQVALARQDGASAMAHLGRALQRRPHDTEALLAAASAALLMATSTPQGEGDADRSALIARAEELSTMARVLSPADSAPLHLLGRVATLRGDWAEGRRLLSQCVDLGGAARVDLARCCLAAGDPASAVAALVEALALAPEAAQAEPARALLAEAHALLTPALELPAPDCRDLARLTTALRGLRDWIAATPALLHLLPRAQRTLRALDTPLDIAVLGEFNAGKSTLTNAIVGEAIVPTGVLPTTAHVNVLRFGPRRAAQLHLKNGEIVEVPYGDLKKRVKDDDAARDIDHIEILYPHPDLRRVHFWDTPGFNALDPEHERHARGALQRAEAILWVLDAQQTLAESEKVLLDTVHNGDERLIVVLNKIDQLGQGQDRQRDVDLLVARIHDILGDQVAGVFPLSALEGLRARRSGDDAASEDAGLAALLRWLQSDLYERVAALKAIDAGRALRLICRDARDHLGALLNSAQALIAQLAAIQEGLRGERANFTRRFIPEERDRVAESLDATLSALAREIEDSLQPAPGLFGALLTRTSLADEDAEFILDLLIERFGALALNSQRRTLQALLEAEQRLSRGVERLASELPPDAARGALRRLEAHLAWCSASRSLLTERVYDRYRAIARDRASSPQALSDIARAARRDAAGDEPKTILRALLPQPDAEMTHALNNWASEYFDAGLKLCDVTRGDLQVMSIEIQALISGLQDTPSDINP